MNRILALFLAVHLILPGCNSSSTTEKKEEHSVKPEAALNITPDQLAIKVDPVCGMQMDQTPIADTLTYKGNLYGFCHPNCKTDFKKDPEGYLAKLSK